MNTLAYIIYLVITYLITVQVGLVFYRNGRLFILGLLDNNEELTHFINRILLTGYYLLNLGYAAVMLRYWDTVQSWTALIAAISTMTGRILLTLAVIHCFNIAVILFISKKTNHDTVI
jgi:hypothetical protein